MISFRYSLTSAFVAIALVPQIPSKSWSQEAIAPEAPFLNGFYANAFAGMIVVDSTVVFPATPSRPRAKYVDQGGDGAIFGGRIGWGTLVTPNVYLGAEIEGTWPWNVTSRLMSLGVEYRARLRMEVGAFARMGWSPDGRSMAFFRAGVTAPRQNFEVVQDGANTGADWRVVPAVGLGAEVALSRRLAFRIDATYSYPGGDNLFESYRLNAGLTYRF